MSEDKLSYEGEMIGGCIATVRGQKVILDADLAQIYGVPTKALNQAVKRNSEKFPVDFMFQLAPQEVIDLKSQIVTSSLHIPYPSAEKQNPQEIGLCFA
jgi:hypothetical protein